MHGPAVYFSESGATEERTYADGVCQGPATLRMPNGDTEERMYEGGALHGIATFFSHMGDRYSSKVERERNFPKCVICHVVSYATLRYN